MKFWLNLTILIFIAQYGLSQNLTDTTAQLNKSVQLKEVIIRGHFKNVNIFQFTGSGVVLGSKFLDKVGKSSFLPALNYVAGVQYEERSPGSYRLSLRGSLIRSPFGIRNVKVYLSEVPLTDATGNTYFNLLDPAAFSKVEILKGPDGSIFGANSGGVIRLTPFLSSNSTKIQVHAGSFGLLHDQIIWSPDLGEKYKMSLHQSFQRSDGYREHSNLRKHFVQTEHHWNYHPKFNSEIKALLLYGNSDYKTPGGLNADQAKNNPRSARPSTGNQAGAVEQQAGIINKTIVGGLTHQWQPLKAVQHVFTVFGSHTKFDNPFITNYEKRLENNRGIRTHLSIEPENKKKQEWAWQLQAGLEWQQGSYHINNYDHIARQIGNPQQQDKFRSSNSSYFSKFSMQWQQKLNLEASLSRNHQKYLFQNLFPNQELGFKAMHIPEAWMPRLAASYLLKPTISLRALVSKGFSAPTLAEIRPSNQLINTTLQAEKGWNKEIGVRFQSLQSNWSLELTGYSFKMKDALVRYVLENGEEMFKNAGEIQQNGLEFSGEFHLNSINWMGQLAWNPFHFGSYGEWSKNQVPGVPILSFSQYLFLNIYNDLDCVVSYRYHGKTALNNSNTDFTNSYHLLQARLTHPLSVGFLKKPLQISIQGDNLLNQQYSLGNDLNAFGGRYYNPAPSRNYQVSVSFDL